MRHTALHEVVLSLGLLLLVMAAPSRADASPSAQIRVNLFGQPCLLQGPVDERTLRLIHSMSPEQLYPQTDSPLTSAPTRKALEKLRTLVGAPTGLDRYRDRLTKRFEAQLVLLGSIEKYRSDHKSAEIIAAGKTYLNASKQKTFDASVRKAESSKTLNNRDTLNSLFDVFSNGIEMDPEEEFHRAIQRLKVQYNCTFEEHGDAAGGNDAAD